MPKITTNERLAVIETIIGSIETDVKDISKSIIGNGNVGLKSQVKINEEKIETLDETIKSSKSNTKWVIMFSIALMAFVTGIVNYIIG